MRTAFANLRNRLVWLDALDMAPLPASTNLFAAILARIENRLVRRTGAMEDAGPIGSFDDSGLLEPSAIYQSAFSQFARLQNDVALAWEGNLRERAGGLDPSQYAMEVMRAEHVRLSLNERLNKTLEALAKELFQGTTVQNPLFALPIDDFDLNPLQCLDLLDLLRIISVPRLFFIVLGHLEMAELVVAVKLAGEIQRLGGSPSGTGFIPQPQHTEVSTKILQVAGDALKKLVPPSQRVDVKEADLEEALGFQPRQVAPPVQSLKELLAAVPLPLSPGWKTARVTGRKIKSLADFLLVESLGVFRPSGKHSSVGAYHARFFLEAPLRFLADYWFSFRNALLEEGSLRT